MATKPAAKTAARPTPTRTQMDVFLGKAEKPLGRLIFVKDGQREFSQFTYSDGWLADAQFFDVSPDLNRQRGYRTSTSKPGHHQTTLQCLVHTLGVASSTVRVLDSLRKQRNLTDYDGELVTDSLLRECIEQARALLALAKQLS